MTFNEQFKEWMLRISKTDTPSKDIIAFNFGLIETKVGFTFYLIGTKSFDDEDKIWVTQVDFEPKEKYLEINSIDTKGLEWYEILEQVKSTIENYVQSNDCKKSVLRYANVITTGFDDGNLIRIK
jgi:hypothetical protein